MVGIAINPTVTSVQAFVACPAGCCPGAAPLFGQPVAAPAAHSGWLYELAWRQAVAAHDHDDWHARLLGPHLN